MAALTVWEHHRDKFVIYSSLKRGSIKALFAAAVLCLVTLASAVTVAAEPSKPSKDAAAELEKRFSQVRPDLSFTVLGEALVPGFYEVQIQGGPVLYVSHDGNYFFDGSLYQVTASQFVDVRDLALIKRRRDLFATRRTDDMIIFKPEGETKAIINVFTDVDCGYCRKLHKEVPELLAMGVEVRYLAYPRAGIDSDSFRKIATAWCAKSPQQALTDIKNGDNVPLNVCSGNPVAEHYRLGGELGVTGTPAIVLMDGTMIPGYQTAKAFAKMFGLK